jgi:hypothetical protein
MNAAIPVLGRAVAALALGAALAGAQTQTTTHFKAHNADGSDANGSGDAQPLTREDDAPPSAAPRSGPRFIQVHPGGTHASANGDARPQGQAAGGNDAASSKKSQPQPAGASGPAAEAYVLYCKAHAQDCREGGGPRPQELQAAINKGATPQQAADQAWFFFQNAEFEDGTPYRNSYNCHTKDHGCDQNSGYGYGLTPAEFARRFKPHYCQGETYAMRHAASASGTSWDESLRLDPYLKGGANNVLTAAQKQCSDTGWGFVKGPDGHNKWVGADYTDPKYTPATAANSDCGRGSAAFQRAEAYDARLGHWTVKCAP